ncbi:archease, partial [Candidatus Woesearchaeota archaeon]
MESNKGYEFLEHTADVKFRAYGRTLDEAFANAALAATHVLIEPSKVNCAVAKKISVKASRKDTLLYEFLQE